MAISIDGLNPDAIRQLGVARTPALHRMMAEGASTLNARTAYERTETLPNHTGMLTGRRVLSSRGHHIDFNVDNGGTVHEEAGRYATSLFDVVHNRGGRTALYSAKEKFALYDRSWGPEHGAEDPVGADHGTDKIDHYYLGTSRGITDKVVRRLETDPLEAMFLHIALPDRAGHEFGFMGTRYLDAVERSDRLVGKVLDAVTAQYLRNRVTVVLTSDHGGAKVGHYDADSLANYRIPFLAWGAGVARGTDLYELNSERTDPGTGRPHYRDAPPIRNTDLASLVTTLLGHRAVPGGQLRGTTPLSLS